jgi:hypothetical protein
VSVQLFIWAALSLAAVLAGLRTGPIIDRLPGELGLPAGAPARPKPLRIPGRARYAAQRASSPLTEEEQVRLEKELINVRDRQEGRPAATKRPLHSEKTAKRRRKMAKPMAPRRTRDKSQPGFMRRLAEGSLL